MWLDVLKDMKKKSGKTAKDISALTGIPKSTIDKLFSGQTKEPYLSMVRSIVYCLGYTLDDLDDTKKDTVPTKKNENDVKKQQLLKNYDQMNDKGKDKLVRYSRFMLEDPDYLKENSKTISMNA